MAQNGAAEPISDDLPDHPRPVACPSPPPVPSIQQTPLSAPRSASISSSPHRLSRRSVPFSPSKSGSIACVSPTTAHSRALSIPRRRATSARISPLRALATSYTNKFTKEKDHEHIGVTVSKSLSFPFEKDPIKQIENVESKVQDILEQHRLTIRRVEVQETDNVHADSVKLTYTNQCDKPPPFEKQDSGSELDRSSPSTLKGNPSLSRAHSCPRIRRNEDIREFSRRLSQAGAMNNFSNFEPGNPNLARQAPPQAPAQQMNGLNGAAQWPNVGAQSDMNVLWDYIVKLSEMHEQIRAQTQQVASGMQQIDSIRASNGITSSGSAAHVNGLMNGLPPASAESAEIARLQNDLLVAQSRIEDLTTHITSLQTLNTDYENAISHTLDKMRPFAQSHAQALLAQKAHYLTLLEQERSQNLELRLEQSRWQEKAKEIKDMMVETLKSQSESEVGYVKKIARLKADNRSLRRICGVPLIEDSEDDEAPVDSAAAERSQARESVRQSPEQERNEVVISTSPEEDRKL